MAQKSVCAVNGCGKSAFSRGWCRQHYDRWRYHGDPSSGYQPDQTLEHHNKCSVENCDRLAVNIRGFCGAHYVRWRQYGDAEASAETGIAWLKRHSDHKGADCLTWPFGNSKNGRARIMVNYHGHNAARVMCELAHGAPPTTEHHAAHSCGKGTSGCVHPGHLRWATKDENEADKDLHGTRYRGEKHGMAKLTEYDVKEIRSLNNSQSQRDVADKFGISQSSVWAIIHRKTWTEVQ